MAEASERTSFDEFFNNLVSVFDRVISKGEEVVVEKGEGELVSLKRARRANPRHQTVTKEDDEALLSAAGGWADVDTDAFLEDIYESRRSSRAPVEL
mgnify:CR=1 FL=1